MNNHHSPPESHLAEHTPEAIRRRLETGPSFSYLRDFIYGAIDGAVTTFAVVAGVQGAGLSPEIVVILGTANLLGDGFSMAAGNYLGTRAEEQQVERTRRTEQRHIELHPEGEREEIRQIYAGKGFEGERLEEIVEVITSERHRWVETMLREEHGIHSAPRSAKKAATMTLVAFVVVGSIPLIPYVLTLVTGDGVETNFLPSCILTGVAFFLVGTAKSLFVDQKWWRAGLETLAVGSVAALVAYFVGVLLRGLAPGA